MYSVNGMYPAEMRETILSDDNENNNKPICKAKCPKIIFRVNDIYDEILLDTYRCRVVGHKSQVYI